MKESSKKTIYEIWNSRMIDNSDAFKDRFMLDMLFNYFRDVSRYVCDKMFTDVVYWYPNTKQTAVYIDIVELSKEFGEEIIKPWLVGWHERNKRVSAKAPYLKYLKNNAARIIIPLTKEEKGVLNSVRDYEETLLKQKDAAGAMLQEVNKL